MGYLICTILVEEQQWYYLNNSWEISNDNERLLPFPQSSRTVTSPFDGLVSYPGQLLGRVFYPSAEMQLVYSTAAPNWAV